MANWEPLCAIIGLRGTVFLVTEVRLSKCLGTMEVKLLPPPQKKTSFLPSRSLPSFLLQKTRPTGHRIVPSQQSGCRHSSQTLRWVLFQVTVIKQASR